MPYSTTKDVPNHVPKEHKKQWLEVWNSVYSKETSGGKSKEEAESSAFAQANGVIKKEKKSEAAGVTVTHHWPGVHMFYRHKEVGKEFSAENSKKIQNIHDITSGMGSMCGVSGMGGGSIYESARVLEAALPMNTSHDDLRGHLRKALHKAHGLDPNGYSYDGPSIRDVFPEHVVYHHKGEIHKRKYSVKYGPAGSEPEVTMGEPKKVHVAYVDSKETSQESMRLLAEMPEGLEEDRLTYAKLQEMGGKRSVTVTLAEGEFAVREGSTFTEAVKVSESGAPKSIPIKVIAPGWGVTGYYGEAMLKKEGPTAFPAGTKMFWNHATESEESQRPEGNLDNLAAVLTEAAHWEDSGSMGPGLYSRAKVFSDYATKVQEKGQYIGVSINAFARGKEGEAEGKRGRIVEGFIPTKIGNSVDFVTVAGAGGAPIVRATESQRGQSGKESVMTEQEATDLRKKNSDLESELARLREGQNRVLAVATVGSILTEAGVRFSQRVLERACNTPVMTTDGKLDEGWVKGIVTDFSATQGAIITGSGRSQEGARNDNDVKKSDERFKESMRELGVPEAGLILALSAGR